MIPALLLIFSAVAYRVTTGLLIYSGASWLSNFTPLAAIALCSASAAASGPASFARCHRICGRTCPLKSAALTQHAGVRYRFETEGADCMAKSLAAGRIVTLPAITSIARTLGAPAPSEMTLAMGQSLLESVTVVSDAEALGALRFLLERLKVMTEPAAACTLTAADRLKDQFSKERHVVLVLCGGNMPFEDLARLPGAKAQ